ncbi:MAG: N-acetyltransferase family protein [Pseudoxanthomonas sp.]
MTLTVRDATDRDLHAVTALYASEVRYGTATYEREAPDETQMQRRHSTIVQAGYPYLVATIGDDLAGYAYASSYRARASYRWTCECTVYVVPSLQGRGAGRALLTALIDTCTQRGLRQMIAVIGDETNVASVKLHQALGFQMVGRFPGLGRKHGRWLDALQLQRALGDGATTAPDED